MEQGIRQQTNGLPERRARVGAQRAFARVVCLATTLTLPSGCGDDEPALDADRLGDLSASQLESLCEEGRSELEARDTLSCEAEDIYVNLQAQAASCDGSLLAPCDVTVGELRACRRAALADPCAERPEESAAACAPLRQRGCAEDGPAAHVAGCPNLAAVVAPFEGIYEVVRHTRNAGGCDAEGASVADADAQAFFIVVAVQLDGAPVGWLESCDGLDDCGAAARELRQYSQQLPSPGPPGAPELSLSLSCHATLSGALSSFGIGMSGSSDSDVCLAEAVTRALTRAEDGSLRLASQTVAWEKPAEDGACSLSATDVAPQGTPCTELEVYEARYASAL